MALKGILARTIVNRKSPTGRQEFNEFFEEVKKVKNKNQISQLLMLTKPLDEDRIEVVFVAASSTSSDLEKLREEGFALANSTVELSSKKGGSRIFEFAENISFSKTSSPLPEAQTFFKETYADLSHIFKEMPNATSSHYAALLSDFEKTAIRYSLNVLEGWRNQLKDDMKSLKGKSDETAKRQAKTSTVLLASLKGIVEKH